MMKKIPGIPLLVSFFFYQMVGCSYIMKANGSDDMKQETMLAEILKALKLHREQVEKQFVNMDLKFEKRFADMEEKYEKRFSEAKFEKRFDDMDQ